MSQALASFGAVVVDADAIAREVAGKGSAVLKAIRDRFGDGVVGPDEELDRQRLGSIIFSDHEKKEELNAIVHPAVHREMALRIEAAGARDSGAVVVCDVPLLIETGMYTAYRHVILVYVPEPIQIERLMARDRISREQALLKVRSQMPIDEKRKYATLVIDNSGPWEKTREQALSVYRSLKGEA